MSLFTELQNLMVRYRFRPDKRFGQNFAVSPHLIEKVVELAGLRKGDTVLEIGAGTGFLTREMQKRCRVIAVEVDEQLCELLLSELPEKNLEVVCGNFMEVPLPGFNKVAALPPYTHSSDIMYRLFRFDFSAGVLVFQREFAQKLVAEPGFKEYCALSVLTQRKFDASIVERVPPGNFFPKPEGESCILKLEKKGKPLPVSDEEAFTWFMKMVFRFQNKNLKNALENAYPFVKKGFKTGKKDFKERVSLLGMSGVKTNLLSVKEFAETFNALFK